MNISKFTISEMLYDETKYLKSHYDTMMFDRVAKMENDILVSVLKEYLGRSPSVDDYIKCERVFQSGILDRFYFAYEGTLLGYVERGFSHNCYKVTFTPAKFQQPS